MFVYHNGAFVATVSRQHKLADGFDAAFPWLVLHNTGKTRKCETAAAARDECQKVYPGCQFRRTYPIHTGQHWPKILGDNMASIHQSTTIQAYQLRAGGTRARMAILRMIAAASADNFNPHARLQPGDWKGARHYRLNSYASAYCTGLNQGANDGKPAWYSHHGQNFRDERDCHTIVQSLPRGWYTDGDCRETAIGIVCSLTHGRFLAGYRWASNNERVYFPEVFDDETDAAHRANGHAEWFADQAREDSARFDAMADAEAAVTDALETLRDCLALRHTGRRDSDDVRESIQQLRQARETLADATRAYERGA